MRRGSVSQRFFAYHSSGDFRAQMANWAADVRTNQSLLRRALGDIKACEPKSEWDEFSLKVEYVLMMSELDAPWGIVQQGLDEDRHIRVWGEVWGGTLAESIYWAHRYVRHDPERSRRVLRLAFANWLAHVTEKNALSIRPAARAKIGRLNRGSTVYFYPVAADAPAAARRMAADTLAEAVIGTLDAQLLLDNWFWPAVRTSERREHYGLVVSLAGELHKREHGALPDSDQALVGTYLDRLPDDGSEELDDGNATTVSSGKSVIE